MFRYGSLINIKPSENGQVVCIKLFFLKICILISQPEIMEAFGAFQVSLNIKRKFFCHQQKKIIKNVIKNHANLSERSQKLENERNWLLVTIISYKNTHKLDKERT